MNEILQAIKNRRSVRSYTDQVPTREEIDAVIEAGLWAPSGRSAQEAIIVAVTDKALRDRLSRMNAEIAGAPKGHDPFYGAPVVLIVLSRKVCPTWHYDGTLVMGNMLLAAHSLGLGACWIHRAKQEFESEEGLSILKDLGIEVGEEGIEGIGHCILGYPKDIPDPKPRLNDRVFYAE